MRMNKKECRKYAAPEPAIAPGHGLLHAGQVSYIVRTAVKTIDHHRTLVLYIYSRQQAAQGDCHPLWTVFQGKDDFTTLARKPDGTTSWRTSAFAKLGEDWSFVKRCAFYSARDQERVSGFFRDDNEKGTCFVPLLQAQDKILERRRQKRERERDRKVRARMRGLPALPRDLETWAHRTVLPAYFFYDHAKRGKASGICSSCGHEATLTGVRYNATVICPQCGRQIVAKSRGRRKWLEDRATCQVIQKAGPDELVVRILKAYCWNSIVWSVT